MNPIVIWHKWDVMDGKDTVIKPGGWMYRYRIPKIEEFVDGFEYEYLTLMITKPNGDIHVNFQKFTFGSEATCHPIEKIKQMLETGYIRVMNVYESNKTKSKMKLFYFDMMLRELLDDNKKLGDFKNNLGKLRFIASKGTTVKEAHDNIYKVLGVKDEGLLQNQGFLQLGESGSLRYVVTSGGQELTKENLKDIPAKYEEFYVLPDSMHQFSEIWPKNEVARTEKVQVKNQKGEKLAIIGKDDKLHPVYQNKPKQKIGKVCVKLPNPKEQVSLPKKEKYVWKKFETPITNQPSKSENRLVWIANEKSGDVVRLPWTKAEELVTTQGYKYISKNAAKTIAYTNKSGETKRKVRVGKSFTPANGDNGIYVPREKSIPNKSSVHNTHETINLVIPNKDREDLSIGKYTDYELDEQSGEYISVEKEGRGKYITVVEKDLSKEQLDKYGNKIVPSTFKKVQQFAPVTSDLVVRQKVLIKKKKQSNSGSKNPKDLHEYIVTLEKTITDKSGTAEYNYTIIAPNLEKAINRAKQRLLESDNTLEFHRVHGNIVLPLFKARGEEIVPEQPSTPEKKDNSTRSFLKPITVKLHTPLTKSEYDEKSAKLVKKDVFEITKWIREFSKKTIVEKIKKKWKHPIDGVRK